MAGSDEKVAKAVEVDSFLLTLARDPGALASFVQSELAPDVGKFLNSRTFLSGTAKKFAELCSQYDQPRDAPPSLPFEALVPVLRPLCAQRVVAENMMSRIIEIFDVDDNNVIDQGEFESIYRFFFVVARLENDDDDDNNDDHRNSTAPESDDVAVSSDDPAGADNTSLDDDDDNITAVGAGRAGLKKKKLMSPVEEGIRMAKAGQRVRSSLRLVSSDKGLNALRFWNAMQKRRNSTGANGVDGGGGEGDGGRRRTVTATTATAAEIAM